MLTLSTSLHGLSIHHAKRAAKTTSLHLPAHPSAPRNVPQMAPENAGGNAHYANQSDDMTDPN
jgi:hypothetical protein